MPGDGLVGSWVTEKCLWLFLPCQGKRTDHFPRCTPSFCQFPPAKFPKVPHWRNCIAAQPTFSIMFSFFFLSAVNPTAEHPHQSPACSHSFWINTKRPIRAVWWSFFIHSPIFTEVYTMIEKKASYWLAAWQQGLTNGTEGLKWQPSPAEKNI